MGEVPLCRREIKRRFVHFLRTFQDEQEKFVYKDRVKRMCDANKQSLEVATLPVLSPPPPQPSPAPVFYPSDPLALESTHPKPKP